MDEPVYKPMPSTERQQQIDAAIRRRYRKAKPTMTPGEKRLVSGFLDYLSGELNKEFNRFGRAVQEMFDDHLQKENEVLRQYHDRVQELEATVQFLVDEKKDQAQCQS